MVTTNSKEKYPEVYKAAEVLSINVLILRRDSRNLYRWMYVMIFLPIVVYCVLFFGVFREMINQKEAYNAIPLMICYVIYLGCFYIIAKKNYNVRIKFEEAKKICDELSDMVDWTTMRKKQVYNSIDPTIQRSIDEFFEYTMSTLCPFYGGKSKYRWLRMIAMMVLLVIMFFSLLITLGLVNIG